MEQECVFCRIVSGALPSHKLLEDDKHLAFLDAFPLVKGQTNVITKRHYSGYQFDLADDVYGDLFLFAKRVGRMLDKGLGAVRTMLVVQGIAVDHVHIKLFPILKIRSNRLDDKSYRILRELMDEGWYSGYIVSMSGREKQSDEELERVADAIKNKTF